MHASDPSLFGRWISLLRADDFSAVRVHHAEGASLGHSLRAIYSADGLVPQPASIDGQTWIVADARIDGVEDLRRQLRAAGRRIDEPTDDATLILHAHAAWGDSCVGYLLGEFAFVIWDGRRREIFAATDRFGVRPLCYARVSRGLLVSNSAPLLYAHPAVDRELNEPAIVDFLVHGELRGGETAFNGIQLLPPAHTLAWRGGNARPSRYWSVASDEPVPFARRRDLPEEFRELLHTAVADRMRGQQVSVFLSGGLDSAMIAAAASDVSPARVKTYTVAYRHLIPHDELRFARSTARYLDLPLATHFADDYRPFADTPQFGMRHPVPMNEPFPAIEANLFHAAVADSRIVFTGHGTDATLADEPLLTLLRAKSDALPGWSRLGKELLRYVIRYHRWPPIGIRHAPPAGDTGAAIPPWLRADAVKQLRDDDPVPAGEGRSSRAHSRRMLAQLGSAGLPASYTAFASEVGACCSHPFLDARLVEFCLRVPPVPWCWDKHLMREAMRGRLPEDVRVRRKTPIPANRLLAASVRHGFGWLSEVQPGIGVRRFYGWESFSPLAEYIRADRTWQHARPLALEFFLDWWSRQPVVP